MPYLWLTIHNFAKSGHGGKRSTNLIHSYMTYVLMKERQLNYCVQILIILLNEFQYSRTLYGYRIQVQVECVLLNIIIV